MTFYALTDKDEELGFLPIDLIGHVSKPKRYSYLFPQLTKKDLAKKNPPYILNRIERDFAGLEPIQKPISNSSKQIQKNLETELQFF